MSSGTLNPYSFYLSVLFCIPAVPGLEKSQGMFVADWLVVYVPQATSVVYKHRRKTHTAMHIILLYFIM